MRASVISAAVALALLWAAPAAFGQAVTAVTVTTTPSPSRVGEPVELSARVTVPQAPTTTPTGTVQFEVDGAAFGAPVAVANGLATATTAGLAVGTHAIVARYHPDSAAFADATGGSSHSVDKWSSQSAVTVAPDPVVAGQPATFTATVGGQAVGGRRPTGSVQFSDDDGSQIGPPVALDQQGVARVSAGAPAGTYHVHANYSGDAYFAPSSATVGQTVERAATVTTLTSSANPAMAGAQIVLTATVDVVPPADVGAYGTLQATVNGAPLGQPVPLEGYEGMTLTVRAPAIARNDTVGVIYSGDENTLPSSASLNQIVLMPSLPSAIAQPQTGAPTVSQSQLKRMTAPLVTKLKQRGARALAGARLTFNAPIAGTLQQTVRGRSLLASAKRTFTSAGTGTLTLKLTAAGRRQIRRTGSVKLTIVTTFTPRSGTPVRVTERVTARRSPRARASWRVLASRLTRQ